MDFSWSRKIISKKVNPNGKRRWKDPREGELEKDTKIELQMDCGAYILNQENRLDIRKTVSKYKQSNA